MLDVLIGGIIALLIYAILHKRQNKFYIGQKVYYYLNDKTKKYTGRITAIIFCRKEESVSDMNVRRIIPLSDIKVQISEYKLFEIQPILGGEKIFLSDANIFNE